MIGSNLPPMVGAVIYVRVSTKEQTENLSLPTQLRACEEYCRRQGYEILERFHEEGESARTTDCSQLQNLLKYCRTRKGKVHFVVVYNLTRFAREKLDKLDEAFLYAEAIDVTTYGRQRDKLREELTLAKIDHHAEAVDELDVEGILAFAERILPRASDLWVQASLDYKQRLQQLFFPEGIAFDGNRFNRTAVTAPLFSYLVPSESADERVVSRLGIEPRTRRLRVAIDERIRSILCAIVNRGFAECGNGRHRDATQAQPSRPPISLFLTNPRRDDSRRLRFVVDLPANHLGPGWRRRTTA
jgi:Resolvase, N terminal domain